MKLSTALDTPLDIVDSVHVSSVDVVAVVADDQIGRVLASAPVLKSQFGLREMIVCNGHTVLSFKVCKIVSTFFEK